MHFVVNMVIVKQLGVSHSKKVYGNSLCVSISPLGRGIWDYILTPGSTSGKRVHLIKTILIKCQ